jgi:hypothetical protein
VVQVLVWSPLSAEPLKKYSCQSPAVAMTFWANTDPAYPMCRTLLLSTEDTQLLMVRSPAFLTEASAPAPATVPIAIRNKKVRRLLVVHVVHTCHSF